ncbi:hypothetical protein [Coxiella endosymbiont of Ornithodoros amblus]|uniref:hypothetical protein n=1 Tax=Coxiella endosymbiont of Ornithodoros amblus TaxID=1656166 RepID=UPI00244DEFE4|nr:hypothetical protein [Coxiella endosymbiont of Ornithodoros amblus]
MRGITDEELDLLDLTPTRRTFACIIEEIGNENKDNLILEEKKKKSQTAFRQSLKDFYNEAELEVCFFLHVLIL